MFREQAQAQARHRIKSETTQKAGKAKSLRDQKAKVNVMGMLGVMHQKFGTMGGANAVVHSMFEVVEGFGDISTGDARKAADKAAQVVYIASLNGDEETLQRELAPRVAAYEQYAVDAAAAEEAAAAAAAAEEEARKAAEEAAAKAAKAKKGKKGAAPVEEFEPQLELSPPPPPPPEEPAWCIRDARGVEPLALAASRGHAGACKLLIEAKAAIGSAAQTCGRGALHRAAEGGHTEVVTVLIEAGADVASTQANGQSALHSACAHGHLELVEYLLTPASEGGPGAHPSQLDLLGMPPLSAACEGGHLGVVEKLLEARAGPLDYVDDKGWSALHYAVSGGHTEIATTLVRAGAPAEETRGGVSLEALNATAAAAVAALVKEMSASIGGGGDDDEDGGFKPYNTAPL